MTTKTKLMICLSIIMQILFAGIKSAAQTPKPVFDSLNTGDVSTIMFSDGTCFWNPATGLPVYRVPKTGFSSTIFAAGLWVGGLDAGGKLHIAAATYKQNGIDFWPGPMMDSLDYSTHQDTVWNQVWSVRKSTIDSFRAHKCVGIPPSILNWPGNGNVSMGQMGNLAPYVDSDHNGYYDPSGGDYPLIRGDQTLYMIFNDDRGAKHGETGGIKLGIEVHLMAYQYNMPSDTPVYQTTFLHYEIYNRSKNDYSSTYLGYYNDMDIGNGGDDFIGCDSANNYWYTYNGEAVDPNGTGMFSGEVGYGGPVPPPPAQAVAYLCDTMNHFIYYDNNFTVMGNPINDTMYYNYMQNIWTDKTHMTYGGNGYKSSALNTNYMFSGNPATGAGWSEVSAGDTFGDRRGLSSVGPFTFKAGTARVLDMALVFARANTGNQNTSVTAVGNAISNVKSFYSSQSFGCDSVLLGVNEPVVKQTVHAVLYPDPVTSNATLSLNADMNNANLKVYDVLGREVSAINNIHGRNIYINRNGMTEGMYFYILSDNSGELASGKFIVR